MSNFITEMFKSEPHPLENVLQALAEAIEERIALIPLMEKHHDYLEESIDVLMSKTATDAEKQTHLYRFFRLVEMHGKAEEEVLYVELRQNSEKEARLAGFAAQDEHDVAFQLEAELLDMGYRETWNEEIAAKGKVAAGLVQNHIKEEESEMFPLAERVLSAATLDTMRLSYIAKCKVYLDESLSTSVNHPVVRMRPIESSYTTM